MFAQRRLVKRRKSHSLSLDNKVNISVLTIQIGCRQELEYIPQIGMIGGKSSTLMQGRQELDPSSGLLCPNFGSDTDLLPPLSAFNLLICTNLTRKGTASALVLIP